MSLGPREGAEVRAELLVRRIGVRDGRQKWSDERSFASRAPDPGNKQDTDNYDPSHGH